MGNITPSAKKSLNPAKKPGAYVKGQRKCHGLSGHIKNPVPIDLQYLL
jgi:hypothetical protein